MGRSDSPDSNSFVDSFARGLSVIEAFGKSEGELTITEAADRAGISRAAARRLLLTLVHLGYAQEGARGFLLTARAMRLGYSYLSGLSLAEVVEPFVTRLSEASGESASVCVLDDLEVVYVARASSRRVMSINLSIGTRLPAWATAHGRVLLAALDEADLLDRMSRCEIVAITPHTLKTRKLVLAAIHQARADNMCLVDQELESGLRALAVPLRNKAGRVVAALNLAGHADRLSLSTLTQQYLPQLHQAAQEITEILGMRSR
jgi:IclR family pca regulon transcriptional regulator